MEAVIITQNRSDPPQLANIKRPILDLSDNEKMTFCVIEGGMKSGEPAVLIVSETATGSVVLQTSLDKFLMAAHAMTESAKTNWEWEQPEGYASIMPMEPEARKAFLKSIQKELEEYED